MSDIRVCEPDNLTEAKKLIVDFVSKEYGSKDPEYSAGIFNDIRNIPLAYTLLDNPLDPNASGNDNDHGVQATVDLIKYILRKNIDGISVSELRYDSIDEIVEQLLKHLDFDDLVSLNDSDWEHFNKVSKVLDSFTGWPKFEEEKSVFENRIEQLTSEEFVNALLHDK